MASAFNPEREAFWRNLIELRESSQLTVNEICQQGGVSLASFYHWRKRLRAASRQTDVSTPPATPLVPVRIVEDEISELIVEVQGSVKVRIPSGCDEATLKRVLRAVLTACRENASC